jgi:hypothetical protein
MRARLVILLLVAFLAFSIVTIYAAEEQEAPVVPTEKMMLWNGKDLTGWQPYARGGTEQAENTWSVKDDVIRCEGRPNGYMRTEKNYANYLLHVEWRWPERPGNSGVLIHMSLPDNVWPKSLECQLGAGNAGDFWEIGGVEFSEHARKSQRVRGRRVIKLKESSEKPAGQWNSYDIICKDDFVVVLVNGVLQNIASNCSVTSGKICLQSEGSPIEFRNIYLEPLE